MRLPPGVYQIKMELSGFNVSYQTIKVGPEGVDKRFEMPRIPIY
jgi:hypothetical protein